MDIRAYIKQNEGFRDTIYLDTEGVSTIGWGHNLQNPIPTEAANIIFESDLVQVSTWVFALLNPKIGSFKYRTIALVDMMFNLGPTRFQEFKKMIAAIKAEDWEKAADEALDSKWAKQVGDRAVRDAYMLRHNKPWDEAKGE